MSSHSSSTYIESMQVYVEEYFAETGNERATTKELAMWAISSGRWEPPSDLVLRKCRDDFARAMREDYITDEQGRSVRAKHAARVSEGGRQQTFWADIRRPTTTRRHMEIAFSQRREQIVGECKQLNRDVSYYNGLHPEESKGPIQIMFDFRDDIEEGDYPTEYPHSGD